MPGMKRVINNLSPNDTENIVRIIQSFHENHIPFSINNNGIRHPHSMADEYTALPSFYINVSEPYVDKAIDIIHRHLQCVYLDLENGSAVCGCKCESECPSSHKMTISPECWNIKSGNIYYSNDREK